LPRALVDIAAFGEGGCCPEEGVEVAAVGEGVEAAIGVEAIDGVEAARRRGSPP
jgi:hypothetical protein